MARPEGRADTASPAPAEPVLRGRSRLAVALLGVAFVLLLVMALTGPNAASPDLGPRGWAPGSLPGRFGSATTAVALAAAYVLGGLGLAVALRARLRLHLSWWPAGGLAGLALLSAPLGSADHLNYAAYGRIFVQGGDVYTVAPIQWHGGHDPITSHVEAPWTTTPSIYGPFATVVQGLTSWVGGDSLRQTVWVWQVVVVVAWLLCRRLLLDLVEDRSRVDLLWTFNPVVFGTGVLGAHVDVVATALVLLAIRLAERHPLLTGAAVGLAATTKVTYAVVGVALVLGWVLTRSSTAARRLMAFAVGLVLVVVPLHLLLGAHVYDQLGRARRSVSLATPWRLLVDTLAGHVDSHVVRSLVSVLAVVVTVVLVWLLARVTARLAPPTLVGQVMRWTFVLATAYAFAAPYSLPWYDQLSWATLPALAAGALDLVLVGRATAMAVAYVPGRVLGMTARVQEVTLGYRRHVAPYAGLAAWAAVVGLSVRGRRREAGAPEPAVTPASRPPGSTPPSR